MENNDKTIWKYELDWDTDIQTIEIPKEGEILSCQVQNGKICLWVKINPEEDKVDRFIEIVGTGNPMFETFNVKRVFIDTIQFPTLNLVFHIFERVLK